MSEKQKVYISGPISSRLDTYKAEFNAAAELVERAGFIPLNPATLPLGLESADYMRITLAMLDSADTVLLLDGWTQSSGAQLEEGLADYIGKTTMDLRHFKERYFPEPPPKPVSRVERMFGSKADWKTPKAEAEPEREYPEGYRGFLLIRCPECGEIRGFCSKANITESTCRSCGHVIQLENLIPAHVHCDKCGRQYKYRTNIDTQEPVTWSCLNCEAPVDLQMNLRGTALITVGQNRRGGVLRVTIHITSPTFGHSRGKRPWR